MNFSGLLIGKTDEEKLDVIFNKYTILTGEKLHWNDLSLVLSAHKLFGSPLTKEYIFKSENMMWISGYHKDLLQEDLFNRYAEYWASSK
jgi:hypothetical protein